jgi:SAM-dependent methyltransferase
MAPPTESDEGNVWKLEDIEASYWDDYVATRPKYDSTIFNPILDYHTGAFTAALDIGTGAGSALEEMMKKFEFVVGSDNDPTSLQFAQNRFSHVPSKQLAYTLSKGEDLSKHHSPNSFDLITCAETFPLMDTKQAMDNISTLLRPGGSLAIWFYGPPCFNDSDIAAKCQPLLHSLLDYNFTSVVSGHDSAGKASWKRAADGMASWLDYIPFDQKSWQDVRRNKWNTHVRLAWFGQDACDFKVQAVSSIQKSEEVTEEKSADLWNVQWDIDLLKKFVGASFPKPGGSRSFDDHMDKLFEELSEGMGGPGVKVSLSWPVLLILARKRV